MEKTITVSEANRNLGRLLREAEEGHEFVVTRRGRPVARIAPVVGSGQRVLTTDQKAAHERAKARARRGWKLGIDKFDRDSIYNERINRIGRKK